MKRTELIRRLAELGWSLGRQGKGSHEIFVHPLMTQPLAVPRHGNDVPEILAKIILKEARRNLRPPARD